MAPAMGTIRPHGCLRHPWSYVGPRAAPRSTPTPRPQLQLISARRRNRLEELAFSKNPARRRFPCSLRSVAQDDAAATRGDHRYVAVQGALGLGLGGFEVEAAG